MIIQATKVWWDGDKLMAETIEPESMYSDIVSDGGFDPRNTATAQRITDFEAWWYNEGSGPPLRGEDGEEHCKRMCQIAWSNGAFKERECAAKMVEDLGMNGYGTLAIAAAIRKGDQE